MPGASRTRKFLTAPINLSLPPYPHHFSISESARATHFSPLLYSPSESSLPSSPVFRRSTHRLRLTVDLSTIPFNAPPSATPPPVAPPSDRVPSRPPSRRLHRLQHSHSLSERLFYPSRRWPSIVTYMCIFMYRSLMFDINRKTDYACSEQVLASRVSTLVGNLRTSFQTMAPVSMALSVGPTSQQSGPQRGERCTYSVWRVSMPSRTIHIPGAVQSLSGVNPTEVA